MSTLSILLDADAFRLKGFDFAMELTKQLLTLAIAILGISITFTKEFYKDGLVRSKRTIILSWVMYFLSILCGIGHIMGLAGNLLAMDARSVSSDIVGSTRLLAAIQVIAFGLGTGCMVLYGIKGLKRNNGT